MRSVPHKIPSRRLFDIASGRSLGRRANQQDYCAVAIREGGSSRYLARHELSQRVHEAEAAFWFCLCDGMGGHVGGETASRLACDAFLAHAASHDAAGDGEGEIDFILRGGLTGSTVALADAIRLDPELEGMGATLVGGEVSNAGLSWISVGDSLLYHWRDGRLARINADHSMAPILDELASRGELSPFEARNHSRRNALRSAVTGYDVELVDLSPQPLKLRDGDWVLIASDGLATLDDDDIADVTRRFAHASAEKLVGTLLDAVHQRGLRYQDNTAVIAIKVFGEGAEGGGETASAA